ncbi:MAG: hypothetical protein AB8B92_08120 [Gammaproteobacteria bacterium]
MEILTKIIRGIASVPVVGGVFVFVIGFLPLLLLFPLNLSNGLMLIIGGLFVAAWCYFLQVKKIINIVLPVIPIPLWTLGIVMVLSGVYQTIFGNFGDVQPAPEVVKESIKPSVNATEQMQSETSMAVEPDQEALREEVKRLEQEQVIGQEKKQEFEQALEKAKQEAKEMAPKVIAQMQDSLESIKKLKGTPAAEQYEAIMKSQNPENPMTIDDAIAEMEQAIEDFKQSAYGVE